MSKKIPVSSNIRLILRELGIKPANVFRRANLPADFLSNAKPELSCERYFDFWRAVDEEYGDRPIGLAVGSSISLEAFDPAFFAALCSENMVQATRRLQKYKTLLGPVKLDLSSTKETLELKFDSIPAGTLPVTYGIMEQVFMTQFSRLATRAQVVPTKVTVPHAFAHQEAYETFFGVRIKKDDHYTLSFSTRDATRPFLTSNVEMWTFFEPLLDQRLAELHEEASYKERVHAGLYELLPSGKTSIQDAARMLGLSKRSLQRKLSHEGTTFKDVLNETREEMARHYLLQTNLTSAEIAFMLGFDEPNSFFRAFRLWTGKTPRALRTSPG